MASNYGVLVLYPTPSITLKKFTLSVCWTSNPVVPQKLGMVPIPQYHTSYELLYLVFLSLSSECEVS